MQSRIKLSKLTSILNVACTLILLSVLTACNNDEQDNAGNATRFDRGAMLLNYADNIIMPAMHDAEQAFLQLRSTIQAFCANPNQNTLTDARNAFKNAGLQWQYINGFNFGPAAEQGIRKSLNEEVGTFPVSAQKIERYIESNDTSFNNFDRDSRGLYAIDYLLFYEANDSGTLQLFDDDKRKNYLLRCIHHAYSQVAAVKQQWQAYRNEFVNNKGTDIGSSTSQFYNEFLKSYEGLKNFKFGIPLGLRPGQNVPLPANVEAYYSGLGAEFAKEHWKACKLIWEGKSKTGSDGKGLREYVASVVGGEELINSTIRQMAAIDAAFAVLPNTPPLHQLIQNQFAVVENLHTELQRHTRFFKSDLSSLIGIAVTYSSGDGD